ncbi:hypothetical protein EW145_g742 [Phellinidium pouzarii]|uniref:RNA helicase n=1 Tax=Phellinidium pouzarii TaxID=167371 RepID=A0A4S4LH59_9AGAM|nr:hypothetical protein EW145_g742 [Phellinidium pouzarii]
MPLRLPHVLLESVFVKSGILSSTCTWRLRLQYAHRGFHLSAAAAATPKGKYRQEKPGRGRSGSKTLSKTQFKPTSRTRLVRDLKSKSPTGKYEVARNTHGPSSASKQAATLKEILKDDSVNGRTNSPHSHIVLGEQKLAIEALLDEEFDRSISKIIGQLPESFSSPPLMPSFAQSMKDVLGPDAKPTPIQSLALKHLFSLPRNSKDWNQFLLASETGSGKSIAYLLPLLQLLKETEASATYPPSQLATNPRALVLAPTHELSRQLSTFAKALVHHAKLRVLCASRANVPSTAGARGRGRSARQMMHVVSALSNENKVHGQIEVQPQGLSGARPIDLLVSTPVKALEMVRGWGWDKVVNEEWEREGRIFRPGKPEMGLKRVECVVIDEADILFDPDFRETTLTLLSDISAARGYPVPENAQTINYPFHLILTSATIPASLSSYLTKHHPSLTRLASPNLHRLPATLHTEHVSWTGGNRYADIERRLRRVWAEDALRGTDPETGRLRRSRVLVFCNRSNSVDALGEHLEAKGIPNVTLTSMGSSRAHGSNRHLAGFVKGTERQEATDAEERETPHALITTSLLSRGLDFSPTVQHVFIVDSPRNMIDFLHRAGRSGRAGEHGKVVVFGKLKGRGSGFDTSVKDKVRALSRR